MPIAALLATLAGIGGSLAVQRGEFWLGGGLLLGSLLCLRWPQSIWSGAPAPELPPATRRLALLGLCSLGLFFRVYRLNHPGLWGDDALNGLLAYDILDGKITSPFQIIRHSHSNFHALSNYPMAGAFWLFGADLTTLRLPGIILGVLCVPLLYATVAPLFGSTVGLIAALFFASSPPQIIYAKQLVQIVTGEFFQLAGLCLLVRGLSGGRPWLTAAAGVPLALCVYTYHSARIAPLVAIVFGLATLWQEWRARRSRAAGQEPVARRAPSKGWELAAATVGFALVLTPAIIGYVRDPDALVQRVGATSIWPIVREQGWWPLWDTFWRTLLVFQYQQGPEYHWFGIATDAALNAVIGFLAVHGLLQGLLRCREPRHQLLLAWFVVGLVPGLLSTGAPRLYRAFLATPPVYVWAALPLSGWLATAARLRPASARALRGIAVALIVAVPLIDFNYYFYRVYTNPTFRWFQGERLVEMARTLRDAGPGWTGYLLTDNFDSQHESFRFLTRAWNLRLVDVASLSDVLPLREPPENGALFIMSAANVGAGAAIAGIYPGAELERREEPAERSWWLDRVLPLATPQPTPQVAAAFYAVDRDAAARPHLEPPHGLEVRYKVSGRSELRREPYPYYFFMAPPFATQTEAVWRGQLTIPEPGAYALEAESNAPLSVHVDGRFVDRKDRLAAGTHDFLLQLRRVPPRFQLVLSWRKPDDTRELIPPEAFSPPSD